MKSTCAYAQKKTIVKVIVKPLFKECELMRHQTMPQLPLSVGKKAFVPVSSSNKPDIPLATIGKWNSLLNMLAKALSVSSGLIMRLGEDRIEVFQSSDTEGNPYKVGDSEQLGLGLYCETVVGKREKLAVPNALEDEQWKDNPDVKLNMISYLGLPITWPDGEIFGTICVLDSKTNFREEIFHEMLEHFQGVVQQDLKNVLEREELKRLNVMNKISMKETFHRMKNHLTTIYSAIQIKQLEGNTTMDEYERFLESVNVKIRTIVSLHDALYQNTENEVLLTEVLDSVCRKIISGIYQEEIPFTLGGGEIFTDTHVALTVSIIVSELVTNSLKHAFAGIDKPTIDIFIQDKGDHFLLEYKDNGIGIPAHQDPVDDISLGMSLIKSYPQLIGGSCEINSTNGFRYTLKAPKRTG